MTKFHRTFAKFQRNLRVEDFLRWHLSLHTVRNNFRCGIGKARNGKIPIPHRKYRYHIGFSDVVSEKTDVVSVFPMWYRYFRCGIGISDVVSEFFRYVPFPIPHRKLFLTVHIHWILTPKIVPGLFPI
jgi:hypothetical protein